VAVCDLHQLLEGTHDRMLTQENDVDAHASKPGLDGVGDRPASET